MTQRTETDDCGCRRVIYTNKKDPGYETIRTFPCNQHNKIEDILA